MKFIHAADIHLDSPLKGLNRYEGAPVEKIRSATRRALENLVQLALDEQADFVLIAGDLYDGDWNDYNTGLFFIKQVTRLRDAGIPLYAITGNHDAENKMTRSLRLPANPDGSSIMLPSGHIDSTVLEDLGVAIHGRGFKSAKVTDNVAVDYPSRLRGMFNIGMLHTSLDGESEAQHARYAPCKLDDMIAKQYDYWALGHIHQRQIRCDDPVIAYSGNLQGRHIREPGAKGCLLVSVDQRGNPNVEFKPLDVFRWLACEVDATGCQQAEEVLDRFSTELEHLISLHAGLPLGVRVTISGDCPAHHQLAADAVEWINQLRNVAIQVSGGAVWVEKVFVATTLPTESPAEIIPDGPIGELLKLLAELRENNQLLATKTSWQDELHRKLPSGLPTDEIEEPIASEQDPLVDEIEALLTARLSGTGKSR